MKPQAISPVEQLGSSESKGLVSMLKRWLLFLIGLFVMAMGAVLSVKSHLGVSPINSLPHVLNIITGLGMGLLSSIVLTICVFLQVLLQGRHFPLKNLFQIPCAVLFGFFISMAERLLDWLRPSEYLICLGISVTSVFVISIGLSMYMRAQIILQPLEGLLFVIMDRCHISFPAMKMIFDCCFVALSLFLSLVWGFGFSAIREGTLLAAVFVGPLLKIWKKIG